LTKRHRWKEIKNNIFIKDENDKEHKILNSQECIYCKLKKGFIKKASNRYWSNSFWDYREVYYKDKKILSYGKLPFACIGKTFDDMFFKKEDFVI